MIKSSTRPLAISVAVVAMLLAIVSSPVLAITNGEPDNGRHPYVGLMVAHDAAGNALWRCSGTLMSSRVFLVAGHCTEAPAATAQIWFDEDLTDAALHSYPTKGDASGKTYTHPDYDPDNFVLRDVGLVILDRPYRSNTYGQLPRLNSLESLKPSNKTTFTSVGYGRQDSYPDAAAWKNDAQRIRLVAYPQLKEINTPNTGDYSLWLVANASDGGTCFGDSGGPNFLGSSLIVAGVTSYGINRTCTGTSGIFRMDRSWALAFVNDAFDGVMGDDYDGGNS
jgi:secreted trypsin-like serine protease